METKEAIKISIVSILVNVILAVVKMIAGIVSNSTAMISDSIHYISDVASTLVVIIGIKMASKEPDEEHPYGHERIECVAGVILSTLLILVGMYVGLKGLQPFLFKEYRNEIPIEVPGILALWLAMISIVVKEIMYRYTLNIAKKTDPTALTADAHHHRSDALSSIGALIGIAGARLGFLALDSIASIIISIMITKVGYDIFKESIYKMIDASCDQTTQEEIEKNILSTTGVKHIDEIKARLFGNKLYVDVEIAVDVELSLIEAHNIAEAVHRGIETNFKRVKHCMVHVNPYI